MNDIVKVTEHQVPAAQSPEAAVDYASRCARLLQTVVRTAGLAKRFRRDGREYLLHEAWQTIGRFYAAQAEVEWSRRVMDGDGRCIGWEARAVVRGDDGRIISAAESMCCRDEESWAKRPEYAIRSMAQTRAAAKALRQAFAWVAVLAGYAPTPAEEMDAEFVVVSPPDENPGPEPKPAAKEAPPPSQPTVPLATEQQRKAIWARLRAAGLDGARAKEFMSWALNVAGIEELTKKYASAILDDLDKMVEAFLEQANE